MNNNERAKYYFNIAEEKYREMHYYWDKSNWNMVIRTAQETIELLLKGVLKYINIEFPKEHDIGEYFEKILLKRKISYDKDVMKEIIIASKELVKKRAPAYYAEEFYSQQEAEEAKHWTNITKDFVKQPMEKLR